ncbi:hypothetical protein BDV93DRAFT_524646 [Ceratobasidium sp. AG-I]|nr:hypothetical protein BDV93DRAFT_524646 [Ceratobasidium sp. AG-I]
MSDQDASEGSSNASKLPLGSSSPVESQEAVGDESQISTFSIDEEISCGICLGVLESPYTVIPCLHTFDKDCLTGWWKRNNTCPLCKVRATSGRHSFQLQAIVNHYDGKRPSRKRVRRSEEVGEQDARAEIYPYGVAPPQVGARGANEDEGGGEENEGWSDEDGDEELDEDPHEHPGGRIVFPCPACTPGHPSGYVCPVPIPEPSDEVKRAENEEFYEGRYEPRAALRGETRIPFAEGLHTLPNADPLYTNQLVEDISRACQEHVMCASCTAYVPRNWPRSVASICRICSEATCTVFDPEGCPEDPLRLKLRSFNDAGHDIAPASMWQIFSFPHRHLRMNNAEQERFLNLMVAQHATVNGLVVELLTRAGYPAEDVEAYICKRCVSLIAMEGIQAWWTSKKEAGVFPPEVANLPNCWYGRECRTQSHNVQHAERYNHNCDPQPQR